MNSVKMKNLVNNKTMEDELKACLPLQEFLAKEVAAQKSLGKFAPIVLTGLFSMNDESNASIPRKAAKAMCFNLVNTFFFKF